VAVSERQYLNNLHWHSLSLFTDHLIDISTLGVKVDYQLPSSS